MDDMLSRLRDLATAQVERQLKARQAAELVCEARPYRWVGLYDVSPSEIAAIAWTGTTAPAYPRFPVSQGLNGAAVATRQPVNVQDVTQDSRSLTTFRSTRSEAILPVAVSQHGRIVGTIDVESDRVSAFTADDEAFLIRCAQILVPIWILDQTQL
jgi:L-methionine (R)-S-oxide reductase